jgi:phosphoribosyl 1,2-cyclic phosphodiesterase
VEEVKKIGAMQTYLVHMSHEVGHQELVHRLPQNIQPAFDGLRLNLK